MAGEEKEMGWMYGDASTVVNPEDYLTGRKIDKNFEMFTTNFKATETSQIDRISGRPSYRSSQQQPKSALDIETVRKEDPLVAIKVKEDRARREIVENPIKMKQLRKVILDTMAKKMQKTVSKKNKHKERDRRSSSSATSTGSSDVSPSCRKSMDRSDRDLLKRNWKRHSGIDRNPQRPSESPEHKRFKAIDHRHHRSQRDDRDARKRGLEVSPHRDTHKTKDNYTYEKSTSKRQFSSLSDDKGKRRSHDRHRRDNGKRYHHVTELDEPTTSACAATASTLGDKLCGIRRSDDIEDERSRTSDKDMESSNREYRYSDSDSDIEAKERKKKYSGYGLIKSSSRQSENTAKSASVSSDKKTDFQSRTSLADTRKDRHSRKERLRGMTSSNMAEKLREMEENAKWRDHVGKEMVKEYDQKEQRLKETEEEHRKKGGASGFIGNMLLDVASSKSIESRLHRNKKNLQRTRDQTEFYKRHN